MDDHRIALEPRLTELEAEREQYRQLYLEALAPSSSEGSSPARRPSVSRARARS